MMTPRRYATLAALCGTVVFAGWAVAEGLVGFGSSGTEKTDAAPIADGRAKSVIAKATLLGSAPAPLPLPEGPPVQVATLSTPDPVPNESREAVPSTEPLDECLVVEICIDDYLWTLYERTQKVDANKIVERRKVTVKKNGKTRTVVKSFTKVVDENFAWKDPESGGQAGMSLIDYVIGGMDREFKLKLFHALRAMDDAGLSPGITSAFRDDYRQSIASGLKAATDRSYHGGSFRGGYGHGLAADVVSVKGETRAQRRISTEGLWKWIDAHGEEYGVGRPYLDKDPPHVAPIDGKEYADKRRGGKAQQAKSQITIPAPMPEVAQSDRLTLPPACRLHLRARKYRGTSPTDAIGRHQLGSIRVHHRQSLAGRAFARACASRNEYALGRDEEPFGDSEVEENPGGAGRGDVVRGAQLRRSNQLLIAIRVSRKAYRPYSSTR